MSYTRGRQYLWSDLHVWAEDGYDTWDEAVWRSPSSDLDHRAGTEPSGVAIPIEIGDEYVAMRIAQLIESGAFAAAVDRALLKHQGNGGCAALVQHAEAIKAALATVSAA